MAGNISTTEVSGVDPYETGDMSPNILEVMSFIKVKATTVVCCILMQILCVVSQKKLQLLGDFSLIIGVI